MDREARLRQALLEALSPDHLEIRDESAAHAGHAGAGEGGHFRVVVVSAVFRNQDLVSRQRQVYDALGPIMGRDVHALALRTLTPEEWEARRA